jgi:hypothetical protein
MVLAFNVSGFSNQKDSYNLLLQETGIISKMFYMEKLNTIKGRNLTWTLLYFKANDEQVR